jgi:hypothetical protein
MTTGHGTEDKNQWQMKTEAGTRQRRIEDGDEIRNRKCTKIAHEMNSPDPKCEEGKMG